MKNDLAPFFSPAGVAVIGASSNPGKLSYGILENLTRYGYQGKIYPINPKADQILGIKVYPDVSDVPDPVELAVVVLPAPLTPDILQNCGKRGIKAVIIISGGFREIGEAGMALEEKCLEIANKYGMRLIGPNCVGTLDLHSGLNTTFIKGVPATGSIGFLSQSGAVCGGVVDYIADKHVGFSHFASLGNELDVDETDVIDYFGEHLEVKVIAAYIEGIKNGERFLRIASKVSKKKPIVMLKAGRTEAGAQAVSSHTGSLAGHYTAYQAAFRQAGVIEVPDMPSLFATAWALSCQPLPEGDRVAILTNAGGTAALASDSLAANGFGLAPISKEKQGQLSEGLDPSAQVGNPIDMLGGAGPKEFSHSLSIMKDAPDVDAFLAMLVPQSLVDPSEVAQVIVDHSKGTDKTVLACLVGEQSLAKARSVLHENKVPMSNFPEVPGQVLGAMKWYREWLNAVENEPINYPDIDQAFVARYLAQEKNQALGEVETRRVLEAYGFDLIIGQFGRNKSEAVSAADSIGYPVVVKVVSPQILHKSDLGGIALDLESPQSVENAIASMQSHIRNQVPDVEIEGYLVQAMAPEGLEVIIGMKRDPVFGPLMMFGLGGVMVELYKDVGFGVAPLTESQSRQMIEMTKAGVLLKGYRGSPKYDLDAVAEALGRLSSLAVDHPRILEVEVNPLRVLPEGQGAKVLDARMILAQE